MVAVTTELLECWAVLRLTAPSPVLAAADILAEAAAKAEPLPYEDYQQIEEKFAAAVRYDLDII
jgi:hypothetical protein